MSLEKAGEGSNKFYLKKLGFIDECGNITAAGKAEFVVKIAQITLFIIGTVAALGAISSSVMGGVASGLGSGIIALKIVGDSRYRKEHKWEVIITSAAATGIVLLGTLGSIGVLTGAQVGCSMVGIIPVTILIYYCFFRLPIHHQLVREQSQA